MCENETVFCQDSKSRISYESDGCAGFPGEGGGRTSNHWEEGTVFSSFGDDFELDFIDGVTESEFEDPATETLLDSVINTLTRKEKPSLRKGKDLILCVPCPSQSSI